MKPYLIPLALFIAMVAPSTAQVTIDRADIESWVDVPVTSYAWNAGDNPSGSALPDTTGLAAILAGGDADFRSIVSPLKKNLSSVLKRMPSALPGADSFPNATHVEQVSFVTPGGAGDSTIYRFSILASDDLTHLGIASDLIDTDQDGTRDTIVSRYIPSGWRDRELPAGTGGMWESSFTQRAWVKAPVVGPYLVTGTTEEREYHVTGTTTLTTPAGAAPAIVLHLYEFIRQPQGGVDIALERFSWISRNGAAVTIAFRLNNRESRQRTGLNDIAWFAPGGSSSVITRDDASALDRVRLEQNHPNPCASVTTIPFTLKQDAHVRLTVFDAFGSVVNELVNASMPSGRHTVQLDAGALPPGCYLYRLQAGSVVLSRAMIVGN